MAKTNYLELLKDPRWQKKRLSILERDNWKCCSCELDTHTLHVHHLRYDKGANPWDVEDEDLITLCDNCHEAFHYIMKHPTLGMETFSCVINMYDRIERESIDKYLAEQNKLSM